MFFPILNSFHFRQTEEVVAVISSCHLPTASGLFDFFRLRIAWQTFRHWSVPDSRSWSCFLQPFGNICNRKIMHQMCLSLLLLLISLARSSENRKEEGVWQLPLLAVFFSAKLKWSQCITLTRRRRLQKSLTSFYFCNKIKIWTWELLQFSNKKVYISLSFTIVGWKWSKNIFLKWKQNKL